MRRFRAGDWVRVRSPENILQTLDKDGCLDGLPFMPEMLQFCGRRFRVFKRAHKTCDTVNKTGSRRLDTAVHLEDVRCDGTAHGGCQAGCLLFWKEEWLAAIPRGSWSRATDSSRSPARSTTSALCSAERLMRATQASSPGTPADPTYICQATQLPFATRPLAWWDVRQYIEDYTSGNVGIVRMLLSFCFVVFDRVIKLRIGRGARWFYDHFQALVGGPPYPIRYGRVCRGIPTPTSSLNLQPGEWVRVKDHAAILETLDGSNKNRGLYFDSEEVPYCGGVYKVIKRVDSIIDEKTGKMMNFKNVSVILDAVYCQARYSHRRFFCPRSIYPLWREVWLERSEATDSD